jgi:hypothetical protein
MRVSQLTLPQSVRWAGSPAGLVALLFVFVIFLLGYQVWFAFLVALLFWILVMSGVALFRNIPTDHVNLFFLIVGLVAALALAVVSAEGGIPDRFKRGVARATPPSAPVAEASSRDSLNGPTLMEHSRAESDDSADPPTSRPSVPIDPPQLHRTTLPELTTLDSTTRSDSNAVGVYSIEVPEDVRREVERAITRAEFFGKHKRYTDAFAAIDQGYFVLSPFYGNPGGESLTRDLRRVSDAIKLSCSEERSRRTINIAC